MIKFTMIWDSSMRFWGWDSYSMAFLSDSTHLSLSSVFSHLNLTDLIFFFLDSYTIVKVDFYSIANISDSILLSSILLTQTYALSVSYE